MSYTPVLSALMECEKAIEQGVADVGWQLRKIRDDRLYREQWSTFEDYCRDRWGWSRPRAYQMIDHADTLDALEMSTNGGQPTERTTRPLAGLDDDDKRGAWERATEIAKERGAPRPTGRDVEGAVRERVPARRPQSREHPATFSRSIIETIVDVLDGDVIERILDPFAGTGLVHEIADKLGVDSIGVEIEPEWADLHERTICGDSRKLTRAQVGHFDVVVTSPTYGNRMADKHNANDPSDRATYKHRLGRDLTDGNSGGMQWGDEYRQLHVEVYRSVTRLIAPGGVFVLNVKDHVRDDRRVPVSAWHLGTLLSMGYLLVDDASVPTTGLGGSAGSNANTRIGVEHIYVLETPKP